MNIFIKNTVQLQRQRLRIRELYVRFPAQKENLSKMSFTFSEK
jgi:hypothetical protein